MSETHNLDQEMNYIREEKKRVKKRRGYLERKLQALRKRQTALHKPQSEMDDPMVSQEETTRRNPFNFNLKDIDAEEQISLWTDRFQTSQKTLEQVNNTVGKSINTVSALVEVMNALKGVQAANKQAIPPVSIDQNDPDIRYLRVAKTMLEAVRNPAVRQLVAETSKALQVKKV